MLAVAFGTHNTHKRQISVPPVGFEPTISAGVGPDSPATGTGEVSHLCIENEK